MIIDAKNSLYNLFKLKDLGELKYFLSIEVLRSSKRIILNQRKYILELTPDVGLSGTKPMSTYLESSLKLTLVEYEKIAGTTEDDVLHDITSY